MSLAVTSLGSVGDTTGRSAYTCALSRPPADNALVLVAVGYSGTTGIQPSSVSGVGLVFSIVTSSVTFSSSSYNMSVWRSMGIGLSGSIITAGFDVGGIGCRMLVTEVSGVSASGTSGTNAIGKSATSLKDGEASLAILGPSATSTANAWFAAHDVTTSGSNDTANKNWTAIDSAGHTSPNAAISSAWTTLSSGVSSTWSGSGQRDRGGTIIELVLDNPAGAPATVAGPLGRRLRIPQVPSQISGIIGTYLKEVVRQLNQEGFISLFSAANPNTSGFTGIPGSLALNIGSASSWTRLWMMGGSVASIATNGWQIFRMA